MDSILRVILLAIAILVFLYGADILFKATMATFMSGIDNRATGQTLLGTGWILAAIFIYLVSQARIWSKS